MSHSEDDTRNRLITAYHFFRVQFISLRLIANEQGRRDFQSLQLEMGVYYLTFQAQVVHQFRQLVMFHITLRTLRMACEDN